MNWVIDYARLLQDSALGTSIAESIYLYPLVEAVHLLGLSVSVGLVLLIDLRLLGLALTSVPAATLLRSLRPWSLGGFALTFVSGGLLLATAASTFVLNPAFLAKLVFIALAGANALYFETRISAQTLPAETAVRPALSVQAAGLLSLLLWIAVIACGRLIPNLR